MCCVVKLCVIAAHVCVCTCQTTAETAWQQGCAMMEMMQQRMERAEQRGGGGGGVQTECNDGPPADAWRVHVKATST